ncbi:MAG: hypothetical protein HC890_01905 [Chloroflexaceae bacterium]|nr:hypothetical protein [Chloroflexaceae bacterium]
MLRFAIAHPSQLSDFGDREPGLMRMHSSGLMPETRLGWQKLQGFRIY